MEWTLTVLALAFVGALGAEWKYEGEQGPNAWKDIQSNCGGRAQSPVNIDTSNLIFDEFLASDPFIFHGYDSADNLGITMSNSGHSVQLTFTGEQRFLTGGNLPGIYNLLQIHFHWGSSSNQGSEHALNGKFFPMEMHVVHTHSKYNVSEALEAPNGLAVLGFFFEISDYDNAAMERLLDHFNYVIYKGGKIELKPFPIASLMVEDVWNFYRYQGSLTTPGCYQSVIWTVFNQPIMISERQMEKFRMLQEYEPGSGKVDYMSDNFRPLQKLNGRPLYTTDYSQDRWGSVSGASAFTISWTTALLVYGIYTFL
ncbi:carbonic anhydrase 7-like [Liolophura sinensis]|uniref:carbonic anhydrase 7-like n=1 Tax=Liolophura sinensis TaxID=3198878 RepID=UPI003158BC92